MGDARETIMAECEELHGRLVLLRCMLAERDEIEQARAWRRLTPPERIMDAVLPSMARLSHEVALVGDRLASACEALNGIDLAAARRKGDG